MGCDIHCTIEYKTNRNDDDYWWCFCKPSFERNYSLFGLMAGVRDVRIVLFAPRGIPETLSYEARNYYTLYVDDEIPEDIACDLDGYTDRKSAGRWVSSGRSEWWGDKRVTHPDWHTPSYLSFDEFESCIKKYIELYGADWLPASALAILEAMRVYANNDKYDVRLVFWFDN